MGSSSKAIRSGIARMSKGVLVLFALLLLDALSVPLLLLASDWTVDTVILLLVSFSVLSWVVGGVAGAFLLRGMLEFLEGRWQATQRSPEGVARTRQLLALAVVFPLAVFFWGLTLGIFNVADPVLRAVLPVLLREAGAFVAGLLFLVAMAGFLEARETKLAGWAVTLGMVALLVEPTLTAILEALALGPPLGPGVYLGYDLSLAMTFASLAIFHLLLRGLAKRV